MADTWEYECPQFVDFTSAYSDHEEDDDSWFEVDHEAESPIQIFKASQMTHSENDCNIISDTAPVIVTIPQSTMAVVPPPKDPVIEETRDVNQETDSRSPLNNRSNVLTKEEFYRNNKNRNAGKPPAPPGKENAKKGPSRVLKKPNPVALKTGSNEKLAVLQTNNKQPEVSKPVFAKPLPQQKQHRRSLSAGNLNLKKERSLYTSHKKPSLQKFNSTDKLNHKASVEKLNPRRSVSVEKLNPRRSVSVEKLSSRRSVSTENIHSKRSASSDRLCHSRTSSATSLDSEKSDASGASTFSKPSGVPKIRSKLVPSAYRPPNSSNKLTSADLELQKIEKKRQEALAAKKLAEDSLKKSLQSKAYAPVNSDRKLTVAKGFEFKSDKRLRTRSADYVKSPNNVFAQNLRKDNNSIQSNKPPKRTVVQPFKLSENKKQEAPSMKFQTVAEQIRNFSKKTPERFRKSSKDNKAQKAWSPPRCTIPRTPNFTCQQRSRPVHVLSTKEIEDLEIEEIQKYKFKAKEVDKKIFHIRTGIKEVAKREVTIPHPFDLPGSKVPTSKKRVEEEHYEFHARPLPTNILEGVVGVKPTEAIAPTMPESPAFALKQRMQRFAALEPKQETVVQSIRARPYVHSGIKFEPKLQHRTTVAEPFTFVQRIKENQIKKEKKIQKMIEEASKISEFSANPIPDFSTSGVPRKRTPSVTKPAPFKHHIEERVEKRIEENRQQRGEEMRLQQEKMQFKAQSCEVVKKAPFMPQLDHKCTQEHSEFSLYTEARHAQRIQFEEQKKAREAELLALRLEAERLHQEDEEREIQRLRQEAVHKANPIRCYKPVEVQPKSYTATVPLTPKFATKNRVRTNDDITYE